MGYLPQRARRLDEDDGTTTLAAADFPIRWPPAVDMTNRPLRTFSRHAWPPANGLTTAAGRPWRLLHVDPCAARQDITSNASPCAQIKLTRPPHSPGLRSETMDGCARSSPFDCRLAGRLNRRTSHMPAGCILWYVYGLPYYFEFHACLKCL